ncbi:probable Golgi SNAP receptor complex member 2 [Galleria mellonella]|uniref:Probable Golgi SNAP receptor complex member 2 n=1 Tax=Galleria mellonella TaxID=7137 RepID=A0A6J1X487_GALME|nr:probable Golgi SNAP receptor complex member 2 [Galleria mellonella]XP_052753832.1 probable Golgi SNAP receptor complex member 2 [Galleria mellonella]XP_052753833.1 probable Golgi SNAP receptor complex member 2 [Galleria mellonella]
MEVLYHQTSQLIQETSDLFQKLDKNPANCDEIESAIQSKINAISANCEKLDIYVYKTPINQRPMAKMRVDQLKYDNKHIQASLTNSQSKRIRREQERLDREQLLNRRFGHDHTEITVDYLSQERNSLQNSHRNVDEMIHTGSNILGTLRGNRETLKGAHRRLIDLANTLGLSNATISLIERRVSQDKYILFGGMFLTLTIIVLVIIYLT